MSAPPIAAKPSTTATSPTGATRTDQFLSPRVVAREAAKIFDARDIEVRPDTLRKLVTRFIRDGHTTTNELENYILGYADPTGETAVRNVMRGRA